MLKSEAERAIRKAMEDTDAKFTEEQIQALSQICLKIASTVVEEAFANWRPGSGGKPQFFA
jgi:hypothetical protein